jgi:hypothetical protein
VKDHVPTECRRHGTLGFTATDSSFSEQHVSGHDFTTTGLLVRRRARFHRVSRVMVLDLKAKKFVDSLYCLGIA